MERIVSGGMIATLSVEVESWTETDTTGRKKRVLREETKERKKERKLKKRRGKSGYPLRVLKSSGRNTAETASPSSTRSATFAKNFHN